MLRPSMIWHHITTLNTFQNTFYFSTCSHPIFCILSLSSQKKVKPSGSTDSLFQQKKVIYYTLQKWARCFNQVLITQLSVSGNSTNKQTKPLTAVGSLNVKFITHQDHQHFIVTYSSCAEVNLSEGPLTWTYKCIYLPEQSWAYRTVTYSTVS